MKFHNLKEASERVMLSRTSIYRFYQRNPEYWHETKLECKKRMIPESHLLFIEKINIYTKAIKLEVEVLHLKRLIETLAKNPQSIQYKCFQRHWDWFGTIAFEYGNSNKSIYKQMQSAFIHLVKSLGKGNGLRIFFTIQQFAKGDETHIHFILAVDERFTNSLSNELRGFFNTNQVELKTYDKFKTPSYYLSLKGQRGEDWDMLGI